MKKILIYIGLGIVIFILFMYAIQGFFAKYELISPIIFQNPIQKKMRSPLPLNPNTVIDIDKLQEQIQEYEKSTKEEKVKNTTPQGKTVDEQKEKEKSAIKKVFSKYNPEVAYLSDYIVEEQKKYPIYKKYPYLIAAIVIKETGAGKQMARSNNLTNWGLRTDLKCPTYEFCLERVISGIGGRTTVYEEFRRTGDLLALLNKYAPPQENDTDKYLSDMRYFFNEFKQNEN